MERPVWLVADQRGWHRQSLAFESCLWWCDEYFQRIDLNSANTPCLIKTRKNWVKLTTPKAGDWNEQKNLKSKFQWPEELHRSLHYCQNLVFDGLDIAAFQLLLKFMIFLNIVVQCCEFWLCSSSSFLQRPWPATIHPLFSNGFYCNNQSSSWCCHFSMIEI